MLSTDTRGALMEYEFTFVVSGVSVENDEVAERLHNELDAMLTFNAGRDLLTVAAEGVNAVAAAASVVHRITQEFRGLRILRLDRDLVGIPEIAQRSDRSRQNVHQWVTGERRSDAEAFPIPEAVVGRAQIWLWGEVHEWLRRREILDEGVGYPTRREMTEIDFAVEHCLSSPFRWAPIEGHQDGRQRVLKSLLGDHLVNFSHLIASLPLPKAGPDGSALVLAGPNEPSHQVMRFVAEQGQDVVLITSTAEELIGVHFSSEAAPRSGRVVPVPPTATVWDLMELVKERPTMTSFSSASSLPSRVETAQVRSLALAINAA